MYDSAETQTPFSFLSAYCGYVLYFLLKKSSWTTYRRLHFSFGIYGLTQINAVNIVHLKPVVLV